MKLLVAVWLLVMAAAALFLPAFRGELGASDRLLGSVTLAALAVAALLLVRQRADTAWTALVSSLPALGVLVVAAVAGSVLGWRAADARGEPIFLFFGIALWASWVALVVASAALARARWSGFGGLGVTLLVSMLGLFLLTAQID